MVILKEITDKSWFVLTDDKSEKIGILSSQPKGNFKLIAKGGEKVDFKDEEDVKGFFDEDVFNNVIVPEEMGTEKEFYISGFPVDYDNPIEAGMKRDGKIPVFKKTKTSKVFHCAGYYCVKFPKGWIHSFCPKLSTLDKYEYVGPFKTEIEMKSHLSMLKRKRKSKHESRD